MKQLHRFFSFAIFFTAMTAASLSFAAGNAIEYNDDATPLEGYWAPSACESSAAQNKPTILIVHQWKGLTDNEKMRADMLAAQCYNAFAIDMYGKGVRPASDEEAGKLAGQYKNDLALAHRRLKAALDFANKQPGVDKNHIAVIGYCFGGTMALELARIGADIDGAVSFHGALATKEPVTKPGIIKASIQVHHGAADPLVPQEEVAGFINEMKAADADWSLTQYAHAVHAFTQKEAGNDLSKPVAYDEKADKRSWEATLNFLKEIFSR